METEKAILPSWYSDEDLMQMSSENPELRFERNADGTLETMPPTFRKCHLINIFKLIIKILSELFFDSTNSFV
jgi:Uma2 family endonuclease